MNPLHPLLSAIAACLDGLAEVLMEKSVDGRRKFRLYYPAVK